MRTLKKIICICVLRFIYTSYGEAQNKESALHHRRIRHRSRLLTVLTDATSEAIISGLSNLETELDIDPNYDEKYWSNLARLRTSKVCAHPITPTNGQKKGTSTNIGDSYAFSCKTGFKLMGSEIITCMDHIGPYGIWTDYYPYCVPNNMISDSRLLPQSAKCSFEDNLCGYLQDVRDDEFDWIRFTGSTKTRLTGPSNDHTYGAAGAGHYMYAESSSPRVSGEKARIYSGRFPGSNIGYCIQFWYHMYGENIGALNVYIKQDNLDVKPPVLHLDGNKGNEWKKSVLNLSPDTRGFKIVFEAIIGSGFRGDIAIDDIAIVYGECGQILVG